MERTDTNGEWHSDDGVTWVLVTPSAAFLTQRAADPEPEIRPSPEVIAAQAMHDEISSRLTEATTINAVKLAITDGLDAAILTLQGEGQL
jgi:hypothetical protein